MAVRCPWPPETWPGYLAASLGDPQAAEPVVDQALAVGGRHGADLQSQGHVLGHGGPGQQP